MATKIGTTYDFLTVGTVTGLAVPTASSDAVRLQDLNDAIEGLSSKDTVRAATQVDVDLANPPTTVDGITMVLGDRILVKSQVDPTQNGIYIYDVEPWIRAQDANTGAELNNAIVSVREGTDANSTYRQITHNPTLTVDDIVWVAFGTSAPTASTTQAGILEIADQSEVDSGTATNLAITPQTLAGSPFAKQKIEQAIGDGTATSFTITHNWNTFAVFATVMVNSGIYDDYVVDVQRTLNTVVLTFNTAPAVDEFLAVIMA